MTKIHNTQHQEKLLSWFLTYWEHSQGQCFGMALCLYIFTISIINIHFFVMSISLFPPYLPWEIPKEVDSGLFSMALFISRDHWWKAFFALFPAMCNALDSELMLSYDASQVTVRVSERTFLLLWTEWMITDSRGTLFSFFNQIVNIVHRAVLTVLQMKS